MLAKRIALITCVFPPEPVVSSEISYSLVEEISKNHKVKLLCPPPSRPNGFSFEKENVVSFTCCSNVELHRANSFVFSKSGFFGRLIESISFGISSYIFIMREKSSIDIVYMNTWPLFGQLGVALVCRNFGLKYIVHVQDIYPESLANKLPKFLAIMILNLLMPIEKYVMRNAFKIVVVSDYMRARIITRGKVDEEKISVVHNWQDEDNFKKWNDVKVDNERLTFMYLGNIGPVANIPFVIQTFHEANLDAILIVAGSGSMRKDCQDLVNSLGISTVYFLDVASGEVPRTQSKADILILSTISNGARSSIPSKLPAYMFSKKPIFALVDDNTDTYNAIMESKCGWVVSPKDKFQIIDKFKEVANKSKSEFTAKGLNGYCYAKEHFSKTEGLKKLTSIILDQ
jgi:glycosyltransferase involved in cell wall biosynthesis